MKQEISKPGDLIHQYLCDDLGYKHADVMQHFGLGKSSYYRLVGNMAMSKVDAITFAAKFNVRLEFLFPKGFYCPDDFPAEDIVPVYPEPLSGESFEDYCSRAPEVKYCLKHWLKLETKQMVANRVPQALAYHKIQLARLASALGVPRVRRQFSPATNYGVVEALKLFAGIRQLACVKFTDLFPEGCIELLPPSVAGYRHTCTWGYHKYLHTHDLTQCDGKIHPLPLNWQELVDAQGHYHVAVLEHMEHHPDAETIFKTLSEIKHG